MASLEHKVQEAGDSIYLVQITDSHLFEKAQDTLAGLNCHESLQAVVSLVQEQQQGIDGILCTGDIAQDGSAAAYQRFCSAVSVLDAPLYFLPGNHDSLPVMRAALQEKGYGMEKKAVYPGWLVLFLDSSVPGKVEGRLSEQELDFLDRELNANQNLPQPLHVLVCLHHNPLPVDALWLQKHCLKNSQDFFRVTDKYKQIRSVLWGHIHQERDERRKGVRMLASPSTCVQFKPAVVDFTLDTLNPGYRWLRLASDGSIVTGVERVRQAMNIDFSSQGY